MSGLFRRGGFNGIVGEGVVNEGFGYELQQEQGRNGGVNAQTGQEVREEILLAKQVVLEKNQHLEEVAEAAKMDGHGLDSLFAAENAGDEERGEEEEQNLATAKFSSALDTDSKEEEGGGGRGERKEGFAATAIGIAAGVVTTLAAAFSSSASEDLAEVVSVLTLTFSDSEEELDWEQPIVSSSPLLPLSFAASSSSDVARAVQLKQSAVTSSRSSPTGGGFGWRPARFGDAELEKRSAAAPERPVAAAATATRLRETEEWNSMGIEGNLGANAGRGGVSVGTFVESDLGSRSYRRLQVRIFQTYLDFFRGTGGGFTTATFEVLLFCI